MQNLEQIKEIAIRIKDIREINGVTEVEIAKELDIDLETYLSYESGSCDIPIGFLYELANRFSVELTALLTGGEPKLHQYEVVKKGQGLKIDRRKQYDYSNLAYNFVHKKMEPFLVKVPETSDDTQITCSQHLGQEFNYILEGRLKIVIGNHEVVLETGDSIYFNASCQHGMKALDGKSAQFIAIIVQ